MDTLGLARCVALSHMLEVLILMGACAAPLLRSSGATSAPHGTDEGKNESTGKSSVSNISAATYFVYTSALLQLFQIGGDAVERVHSPFYFSPLGHLVGHLS